MLAYFGVLRQDKLAFHVICEIPVDYEYSHSGLIRGQHGRDINIGNRLAYAAGIGFTIYIGLQGVAPDVLRGKCERPLDGLGPDCAARLRHDGGKGVDKLSKAGNFDRVCIVQQGIHHAANQKSISKVKVLFFYAAANSP